MKTVILSLLALAFTATSAMATSPIRYQYSQLEETRIDSLFNLGGEVNGDVKIDYVDRNITLKLVESTPNLSFARSFTMIFPIGKAEKDCGSLVYTAYVGERHPDGYRYDLTVMDHSRRLCKDVRPPVEVILKRTGGIAGISIEVELEGSELSPLATVRKESSTFDHIVLDEKMAHRGLPVTGDVVVDYARQVVTLTYHVEICPPVGEGMIRCLAEVAPVKTELPIVSNEVGSCGSTFITAKSDPLRRGGGKTTVVVQDNRTRICEDLRPGVEVTLSTSKVGGPRRGHRYESHFSGPALQ